MTAFLLMCVIVGISDGDTIKARCDNQTLSVRLAEIDAPEKSQPFGLRSKQALAELCFGKNVQIEEKGHDRYGRTVGRVFCAGSDANLAQVSLGMAWAYDKYLTDPRIKGAERAAQSEQRGLWSDPKPIPPWEWRKAKRSHGTP